MAVVFLSQSSRDENKALEALKLLEEAGIPCWYAPRDTQPGANYALEIPRAIEECSYFVLLLSNESQESPYVKLELDQAIKRKKAILPVLLEQMQQTEDTNFFLNAKQAVDGTKDFSAAIRKVIARINGNTHVRESHPDYICCPRCGKSVLRFRNGKGHYLDTEKKASDRSTDLFMNMLIIPFGLLVFSFICWSRLPGDTPAKPLFDYGMTLFYLSGILSLLLGFARGRRFMKEWYAIRRSNLQVWHFVCLGCRRKFHYYAPLSDKPEDRVKELFYEVNKKETHEKTS